MIYLQSTSNVSGRGVKSLTYGASGVGKTRMLATAPAPVIFSAEAGLLSLRSWHLPYYEIRTLADLQQGFTWLNQSHESRQFASVALDSLSEVAEVVLKHEMGLTRDGRKAYGEMSLKMIQIVKDFRDLPNRNVIIIAKQEWAKDEASGMFMFQPMMPGQKTGPALPYLFDEVFQHNVFRNPQTGQLFEAIRTRRDNQNEAKDRSGALAEFEPPDWSHIYRKIANGKA